MKKSTWLLLICIVMSISSKLVAQTGNSLDERYKPPANSVFGSKSSNLSHKKNDYNYKQSLSFPTLSLARKEISIDYQFRLAPQVFGSLMLGVTFGDDYVEKRLTFSQFLEGEEIIIGGKPGYHLNSFYYHTKYQSGFLFSSAVKLYSFEGESSSDFYCIRYKFVSRNYELPDNMGTYNLSNYPDGTSFNTNIHYVAFQWGYSWCLNLAQKKFIHELSFGFGIKLSKWDQYLDVLDKNNYVIGLKKVPTVKITSLSPCGFMEYRLGFGW
ncbi:MAG: hypothetical protein WCP69_08185 [Bacteroidota bacterium]